MHGQNTINRIPSRHDNPFATCWTRPGTIDYYFPDGESVLTLVQRLEQNGWWGQIVGPHGSGKSTLLVNLIHEVARRRQVRSLQVCDGRLCIVGGWSWCDVRRGDVVAVDGYDRLGFWVRWRIAARLRLRGCGLVVTTHRRLMFGVLVETAPNLALVQRLVQELTIESPSVLAPADVAASYASHNGNVREIFFDLYDRYERHARECMNR